MHQSGTLATRMMTFSSRFLVCIIKRRCQKKETPEPTLNKQLNKYVYNTQEPELSSKSEITHSSAMPWTLRLNSGNAAPIYTTSTQAMVSALLLESRGIILAAAQHYWKYIMRIYYDSTNMAVAC